MDSPSLHLGALHRQCMDEVTLLYFSSTPLEVSQNYSDKRKRTLMQFDTS